MNNRRLQRLKAIDMRVRNESNGHLNLKLLCKYEGQALRDYRDQVAVCAWPDALLRCQLNKFADCADIVKF